MSGNQKQPAEGRPQGQRYSAPIYQSLTSQPRQDNFHVPTPPYGQQPNQSGNQAQNLRNIGAPAGGPPNQASTPPTNDLKVQSVPQQQPMNHMYVPPQPQVRSQGGPYFRPQAGPPNQQPRMANQHRGQQQALYQQAAAQQAYISMPVQHMFITNQMPFAFPTGQRPQYAPQTMPYGPHVISPPYTSFTSNPGQGTSGPYPGYYSIPRSTHPPPTSTVQPNPAQPLPTMPMPQAPAPPPSFNRQQNKRRANAIPIIDPNTGVDKLDEVYEQANSSHPASGESSARQTPQPAIQNSNKEVQAAFAKQVAQAINSDESNIEDHHQEHSSSHHVSGGGVAAAPVDHIEQPQTAPPAYHYQPPPPQQQPLQPSNRLENLVQLSNLKVQAKEFVCTPSNTAKETTPIVSANIDAEEVTLPHKQVKDRESPAKGRKQREQQQQAAAAAAAAREQHKDSAVASAAAATVSSKDTPAIAGRDYNNEKDLSSNISKNEKQQSKEAVNVSIVTPAASLTAPNRDNNKEVVSQQPQQQHRADDKKNQKKEQAKSGGDARKLSSGDVSETASVVSGQSVMDSNAKNKNASQRGKDASKQQTPAVSQKQQAPAAPVPQPQPAKANNKSSKKTELNQKGANKEGTDMDAFNDNVRLDAVNANIGGNTDVINANDTPQQQQQQLPNNVVIDAANENIKNSNTTTTAVTEAIPPPVVVSARPDTRTQLPKSKIDVTDIVREKPKTIKPFPAVVPQVDQSSKDETDRAAMATNDKLIQAKNEANSKTSTDNDSLMEIKSDLPYREDQWTPNNLDGKKVYEKEFLLALRNNPQSRKRPDNLPDMIVADERNRLSDGRYSMGGRTDFTNPPFANYGGKSNSQRGSVPKRGSQSGKVGGGQKGANKNSVTKVSISLNQDVKLHEVENAWKPARLKKSDEAALTSDEDKSVTDTKMKFRGILNRLTPQKFDALLAQVRQLKIDSHSKLMAAIDLVFEKAIDEPNFSVAYALLCRELAMMAVTTPQDDQGEQPQLTQAQVAAGKSAPQPTGETVNFRKLLITRCQSEFEKQSKDETARLEKIAAIEKCMDPDKKKELQFEVEEWDRRMRVRSVGNVRFIGELFKQHMLTVNIMQKCMDNLIKYRDEEDLECLCKLLTTIGKEIEVNKKHDLSEYFVQMKNIVDDKHRKISSRVRFMMQDVIDLRRNKWIPRRQDSNPKTIDQIQKEAENEHLNIQVMNQAPPSTPRRDDRGGGGGGGAGGNADRKRKNVTDDGWQTTASRNNRATPFTVQSDKLKNKPPQQDEPLGSRQMFGNWSKGSNIKTDSSITPTNSNMYAALENMDMDKRPSSSRNNKDPYSSKGPSLERSSYNKSYDGRNSRSGSQHRSNDRESQQQQQQQQQQQRSINVQPPMHAPAPVAPQVAAAVPVPKVTDEQLERLVKNCVEEFINDLATFAEVQQDIVLNIPASCFARLVSDGYLSVLDRSTMARIRTGELFAKLIKAGTLPLSDYATGLEEIVSQADDLQIDIPKIWEYLGEILVHLICEEALPLARLHKCCEMLISQGHGAKLLAPLFKLIINQKGPNFLGSYWQLSGLSLSDFVAQNQVSSFITDNKLEFLCGGDTSSGQSQMTYEQIHKKLMEFFELKTSFDDVVNWITANIGDRVRDNKFIRTLATAVFENSIQRNKLVVEILQSHYKLLHKYVDNNPTYELQCLYALQALIHKLEHPKGLLLSICDRLYEDTTFSQESFIAWEISEDPVEQEGKGVALKQLTSFFTQLKENEEEDYGSTTSEET